MYSDSRIKSLCLSQFKMSICGLPDKQKLSILELLSKVESRTQRSRPRIQKKKKIRCQGQGTGVVKTKAKGQRLNFSKNYGREIFYSV